jgi:hypothetical protein
MASNRDVFLDIYRWVGPARIVALERDINKAIMDGDDAALAQLRADRRTLIEFLDTVQDGDRAALAAQWPTAALGSPCPEWFTVEDFNIDTTEPPSNRSRP